MFRARWKGPRTPYLAKDDLVAVKLPFHCKDEEGVIPYAGGEVWLAAATSLPCPDLRFLRLSTLPPSILKHLHPHSPPHPPTRPSFMCPSSMHNITLQTTTTLHHTVHLRQGWQPLWPETQEYCYILWHVERPDFGQCGFGHGIL